MTIHVNSSHWQSELQSPWQNHWEQQLSDWAQQTPKHSVRTWQVTQSTAPGQDQKLIRWAQVQWNKQSNGLCKENQMHVSSTIMETVRIRVT